MSTIEKREVMSMLRTKSWPLLDNRSRGDAVFAQGRKAKDKVSGNVRVDAKVRERRLLWRHYYPEGGWGWVIALVGTMAHVLSSGFQLSAPAVFARVAAVKYGGMPIHFSGRLVPDSAVWERPES